MASRFASVTEEQILSIDEAAIPKNTNGIVNLFNLSRYFHFLLSVFVALLLEINQILDRQIIQLVWYIPKHLFTSVSVKVVDIYIQNYSPPLP